SEVDWYKRAIKELEAKYKLKQKEYPNYSPENLGIIKTKYELDVPFPSDTDKNGNGYSNQNNTSSWSIYEEQKDRLRELQRRLKLLENPATRQRALGEMQLEVNLKNGTL